jgi:ribose 5-phosphate isomerase A
MLREKLLLASSPERYILIDESKRVTKLGEKAPVPIEVIPEALQLVQSRLLEEFDVREIELRMAVAKDGPVVTEHGNVILEITFADVTSELDVRLNCVPGVVGSGLFFGFQPTIISA